MREIAKSLWKRLRIDAIDPMLIHTAGRRTAEFRGIRPDVILTRTVTAA
jgi:hypothetical protein